MNFTLLCYKSINSYCIRKMKGFVDLFVNSKKEILAVAYEQYLLKQVMDAVKARAEAHIEYNKPRE